MSHDRILLIMYKFKSLSVLQIAYLHATVCFIHNDSRIIKTYQSFLACSICMICVQYIFISVLLKLFFFQFRHSKKKLTHDYIYIYIYVINEYCYFCR